MTLARKIAVALLTCGLGSAAVPPGLAGPAPEIKQFFKLQRKVASAQEAGRHAKAVKLCERMAPLAPENAGPSLARARSLALLGDADAAFASLDRALELGFAWPDQVAQDEDLESLRADARWSEVLSRMERNDTRWQARLAKLHRELPPANAERHGSLDALVEAFGTRLRELDQRGALLGWPAQTERRAAILDAKLAALERHLAESADAAGREAAALEAVRTALAYKESWRYWDGDAALVIAKADRFLDDHPESEHRAEVTLQRAVATWKAYGRDDKEATSAARGARALELFSALEADQAEADEAWRSRVWRLEIEHALARGRVTPEQLALHEELAPRLAEDETLADYAWEHAQRPLFRIEGEQAFDGVDLAGQRWTWETMRGRVVLIDFWATWCGPCIGELPQLKEAYTKYHDRGFEIVGVSLDGDDRKAFEKECAKQEVVWPQIWDGKGWQAELARRFRIRGVPTPLLLDREGNIAAMDEDARGTKLVERVAELVGAAAD